MNANNLPWRPRDIADRSDETRVAQFTIDDATGLQMVPDVIDEHARAFIVRAVNAHDDMLAALKRAHETLTAIGDLPSMRDDLAAAIAKAEGA